MSTREAVERYLGERLTPGQSSRGVLGRIRRQLAVFARLRKREDLAALFEIPAADRAKQGTPTEQTVELLRTLPTPLCSSAMTWSCAWTHALLLRCGQQVSTPWPI